MATLVCISEWLCVYVSEVDVRGRTLRSYTDVWRPYHLSLDSEGHVLVADWYNDRILLLNSQLQLQRILVDRNSQVKLWEPTRLCYNELTSQLYVLLRSSEVGPSDVISVLNLFWVWVTDSSLLHSHSLHWYTVTYINIKLEHWPTI